MVRSAEKDADVVFMEKHGLACWSASDYMMEIQELMLDMFREEKRVEFDFAGWF